MHEIYRSAVNRDVPPASSGEFPPLRIGTMSVWPPVVLAPMAGVTNYPFRDVCRRFGAGLYVSEMINARPLVEGRDKTSKLADFGPDESPRSMQLYGTDPHYITEAVRLLVGEGRVDHIDMNFGCPVRKVTSKGGGAALPARPALLRSIVRSAVRAAGSIPVTIKFRVGIDDDHITFLTCGRIAEDEGCAAVGLHARTAAQLYNGHANWDRVAELKQSVRIPVLGNGDIWEAEDALRMMRSTGCDGVIVGRGCLGRPWLFRDLADVFEGRAPADPPDFAGVYDVMLAHARKLADWFGERYAMITFRKHVSWYVKGFTLPTETRDLMAHISSVADLELAFDGVDRSQPFPPAAMRMTRGKSTGLQKVALPPRYFDNPDDLTIPEDHEGESGG